MLTVHQRYRQTNGYRRTDRRTDARLVGDYARGPAESWGGPSWKLGSWAPRVRSRKPARWENQTPIYL